MSNIRPVPQASEAALRSTGWTILTVWECEMKDKTALRKKILHFLSTDKEAPKTNKIRFNMKE